MFSIQIFGKGVILQRKKPLKIGKSSINDVDSLLFIWNRVLRLEVSEKV